MLGKLAFTNKIVAKNLNVNEERVGRITSFFIEELNKELVSTKHPFVYVRGLGTFTLSLAPIENQLKWYLRRLKQMKEGSLPKNYQENFVALRATLFELFGIRRLIKTRRKEIKRLKNGKCSGEIGDDSEGQSLPDNGQE